MDLRKLHRDNITLGRTGRLYTEDELSQIKNVLGDQHNYGNPQKNWFAGSMPLCAPETIAETIIELSNQLSFCMNVLRQYEMINGENKINIKELV